MRSLCHAVVGALLITGPGNAQRPEPVKLRHVQTIRVERDHARIATFSPDGSALAQGGPLGNIRIVDFPSCDVRWRSMPSDHRVRELQFSPDGTQLACCGRHLTIHDAASGEEQARIQDTGITAFAWRRDQPGFAYALGEQLNVGGDEVSAETWAVFANRITSLDWSPQGDVVVGDRAGNTWRVSSGGGYPKLLRHHQVGQEEGNTARSIQVQHAGDVLIDFASHGCLMRDDQRLPVSKLAHHILFSRDGDAFVTYGRKTPRATWWKETGSTWQDFDLPDRVKPLALLPDGNALLTTTPVGYQILRIDGATPLEMERMPSYLEACRLSPDGMVLAIQSQTWSLHPTAGGEPRPLPGAQIVEPGRRGSEFLVYQQGNRIVEYEGRSGVALRERPAQRGRHPHQRLGVGPGGLVFFGDSLIDEGGQDVMTVPHASFLGDRIANARSKNGSWAVAGASGVEGDFGALVVTDPDGKLLASHNDHPVYTLAFSPDGQQLYYACGEGISTGMGPPFFALHVVNAKTLALEQRIEEQIWQWRFLSDQHALASVEDRLEVWSIDPLKCVQEIQLEEPRYIFELSDNLRTLIIGSQHSVDVYRVDYNAER